MKYIIHKKVSLCILFFLLFMYTTLLADWPMYMGNHYLTGNNDEIVPQDNYLNWVFKAPSYLYCPVSHKNMVFVTCLDKYIYALNEITGEIVWKCKLERPALKSSVTWKNYVLVTAGDYIYCVDITTGQIYWSRKDGISVQLSTPIVIHNIVFYGSRKFFYARDVRNGHLIWKNDKVKIYGGTPIYWNQRIYFISKDFNRDLSQLFCLSATNGKLLWKQNIPGDPNIFTPVVYDRKVFIGSLNKLYSFNAYNGEPAWTKRYKQQIAFHTVFANNRLYISLDDGKIYMLDPAAGNIIDSFPNFNDRGANFIIAGETLFIPHSKGTLFSFQSYTKKTNWEFQTDFTNMRGTLSSANGRIYLAVGNRLYSVSTGILPSAASMIASAQTGVPAKEEHEEEIKPVASPPRKIEKEKIEVNLRNSKNNPLPGEITVNQNKQSYKYFAKNGKAIIEVEKDKEFILTAEAKDYFVKTIHIEPEQKKKGIDITLEPIRTDVTYVFNDINFKYRSAELTESSFPALNAIARLFKRNLQLKIEIGGHTDSIGGTDYNLELSQRRADKVKEFLTKNGVTDTRVETKGYGESKPVASNDTDEGRAKNRRVEFKIK